MVKELYERTQERILTGKTGKMTPEEREKLRKEKFSERCKFESTRMRGYELIFPSSDKPRN